MWISCTLNNIISKYNHVKLNYTFGTFIGVFFYPIYKLQNKKFQ